MFHILHSYTACWVDYCSVHTHCCSHTKPKPKLATCEKPWLFIHMWWKDLLIILCCFILLLWIPPMHVAHSGLLKDLQQELCYLLQYGTIPSQLMNLKQVLHWPGCVLTVQQSTRRGYGSDVGQIADWKATWKKETKNSSVLKQLW